IRDFHVTGVQTCALPISSNCSERLRTKRGHRSVPGISSCRLLIIWQPLHTPRAKLSLRAKKALKLSRARALNRIDLAQPSPAPGAGKSVVAGARGEVARG